MDQYQLMPAVTIEISFKDLFVKSAPAQQRRARWAQWLKLSRREGETGRNNASSWTDRSECIGCKHLGRGAWCTLQELPCTVNPIMSFRYGLIGMACMGAGIETEAGEDRP